MKREIPKKSAEKYKYTLLAVAALIVLAGSFVLFYQIQKQQASNMQSSSNEDLTKQIADLNKKIDSLNKDLQDAKNQTPTVETKSYSTSSSGSVAGASTERSGKININSASLGQLDSLTGIGPTYAQRIIDYRDANGGFKSIDEIKNVKGIGDKTFDKFKDQITI